jgi:molybdopterin converting factor small subunit
MDDTGQSEVRVEFFGPFREFGTERLLALEGPVLYGELVRSLAGELGPGFAERAGMKNTTVIVNNKIASKRSLETLEVKPGDRVAFALLLGGG